MPRARKRASFANGEAAHRSWAARCSVADVEHVAVLEVGGDALDGIAGVACEVAVGVFAVFEDPVVFGAGGGELVVGGLEGDDALLVLSGGLLAAHALVLPSGFIRAGSGAGSFLACLAAASRFAGAGGRLVWRVVGALELVAGASDVFAGGVEAGVAEEGVELGEGVEVAAEGPLRFGVAGVGGELLEVVLVGDGLEGELALALVGVGAGVGVGRWHGGLLRRRAGWWCVRGAAATPVAGHVPEKLVGGVRA